MQARSSRTRRGGRFALFCLAPAILLYAVFMLYPTIGVFRMSLYEYTGFGGGSTFVGLDNFKTLLHDQEFVQSFQNTVLLLVVVSIVTMAGGLAIAAVMTTEKLRANSVFRFIFYLPSVLSIVVIAAVFSAIYDQQNGLINGSLQHLGWHSFHYVWLGNESTIIYSIGLAMVWQALGYYMVIYMAGMSAVPQEIYEAAALDGAGRWKQFFSITLPLIWGTVRTTLTFFILGSINLAFVLVHAMTDGGPNGSSEVLLNYMYKQAYTNSLYGYGMAVGVVVFLFSFVLALVISRVTNREVEQF